MEDNRLKYLLEQYHKNNCTSDELTELNNWYHSLNFKDQNFDSWVGDKESFYGDFQDRLNEKSRMGTVRRLTIYATAAAVLIFIFIGALFLTKSNNPEVVVKEKAEQYIHPGSNKAYLTLSDGSKISLTDAADGEIAKQAGIRITKTRDGQLIYKVINSRAANNSAVSYNTIETPRGGQYRVDLPDGSKVWLNAASVLKYPTRFMGSERKVELSGEGYFEIAHNKEMPFRVISNNQTIEVLGTHFNVNTYPDEPVLRTTLLSGSVKISANNGASKILKPGQHSDITKTGEITVKEADIALAVAWKEGKFIFRNEPIESVMRKVSRWYDVDIVYENGIPQKTVWGTISRFDDVSDMLKLIELTKVVQFKVDGRRIIVMK